MKRAREPQMDNAQPVVIRPSRDADVDDMLAIYRHHIRRGLDEGVGRQRHAAARRSARASQESAQPALSASGGDARRRDRGLCLCGAVPQASGLSLHGQALDLRPSGSSRPRHRAAADAGADRRLRRRRLPADDRLYRCRQRRLARPARKRSALPSSVDCPAVAYRFGHWSDSVMVQRSLGAGSTAPPVV